MILIAPLEELAKSDVSIKTLVRDCFQHLKVAKGPLDNYPNYHVYHIGPDSGTLNFSYKPGKTLGGSPLVEMLTMSESGITIIALENGYKFAIHSELKTLPPELSYQEVTINDYMIRSMQLCGI